MPASLSNPLLAIVVTLSLAALLPAAEERSGLALFAFDQPLTFAYGSWEGRARVADGALLLDAVGVSPRGGAGTNIHLDLSGHGEDSPALRVVCGGHGTAQVLKLLVIDTTQRSATWTFALPAAAGSAVLVPVDGATFTRPNEIGKTGPPDLAQLMQWQLIGDWSGDGALDLRVTAVQRLAADDAQRAARAEVTGRQAQERARASAERQAAAQRYGRRGPTSPVLQRVYAAAPDVLALEIVAGRITPCTLVAYQPLASDTRTPGQGQAPPHLMRGGSDVGLLLGPPGREDALMSVEGFSGDPLLLAECDDPANYRVTSSDDPGFASAVAPTTVWRKSKAEDWQQPAQPGIVVCHRVYLQLPRALQPGRTYDIAVGAVNTDRAAIRLEFATATAWTESIHVDQLGFRADDPLKRAFLSVWLGAGGAQAFPAQLAFHLVDAVNGARIWDGVVGPAWPADRPETMATTRNFNGTDVAVLDFSACTAPGRYRLEVEGVGCSYPFAIGPAPWATAFQVQMKGFYNQRSGVELGPPYTTFRRPICLKPGVAGCMPVTQSRYSILDAQGGLAAGDTGVAVPEAWGGYHDAGDWNPRRITHMTTTTFWQLELFQLFPAYFGALALTIPDDAPGPDLLKECQFELDCFRRLQLPDGGCRFGIETDGDPELGEVSWKQRLPIYVYAPDALSCWTYAAVAARAAQVLAPFAAAKAAVYRDGALQAMAWAEARLAALRADGTWARHGELATIRLRAAVCLYALTRDERWNAPFIAGSALAGDDAPVSAGDQAVRDAAFAYARLPAGQGDAPVRARARRILIADAESALRYQRGNAFGLTADDPGRPQFIGFYSTAHGAVCLLRAHALTGDARYLAGALAASLFPLGANPSNLVYTSGLGSACVKPLNLDAMATGQAPPIGLTPYGNIDLQRWGTGADSGWITWPITWFVGPRTQPECVAWPVAEAYWDVRGWPSYSEFCIDQTMGPNAYVWGYLAARP